MSFQHHLVRVALLMAVAAGLLVWLGLHTEIMFADGLRYVAQAQAICQGSWGKGVARAVDHPSYALAIAAVHHLRGGDSPAMWQAAAQGASIIAGVLLVIPLYLFALELYGTQTAWLACIMTFLVPLTGHVLADVLAEGTFLVFWMTGCWAALRFLREGRTGWLVAAAGSASLAFMTRPEGLLLPVALAGTLALTILRPAWRFPWPVWRRAVLILVAGAVLVAGPFMALKGGIATKPAVARLIGVSGRSPAMAVERERPLDPGQSDLATFLAAVRAAARAVQGSVSLPFLVLGIVSLFGFRVTAGRARQNLLVCLILGIWLLALLRLHVTGGYCTPRHAMIFALPVIAAAAHGLNILIEGGSARFLAAASSRRRSLVRQTLIVSALLAVVLLNSRELIAGPNAGFQGYRQAGDWLAAHAPRDARVLDLKGWALFYGDRAGYSFGELAQAEQDPALDWVVAHDALLIGPWNYCEVLRKVIGDRSPIRSFPEKRTPGIAQVHVFELSGRLARAGATSLPQTHRQQ